MSERATWKQRIIIYQRTGIKMDDIKKSIATKLVGLIFRYINEGQEPAIGRKIEKIMHDLGHNDWTISDLDTSFKPYKRGGKKRTPKKRVDELSEKEESEEQENMEEEEEEAEEEEVPEMGPKGMEETEKKEEPEKKEKKPKKKSKRTTIKDVEARIVKIEKMIEKMASSEKVEPEIEPEEDDYIVTEEYKLVKQLIEEGEQVLLVGPSGSGKTSMIRSIGKALGKKTTVISFSGGVRYAQVFGSTQLVNGQTAWKPGPVLQAVQEPGIVCIDECFTADPEVTAGLNGLLEPATRACMTPVGEIRMHPDCVVVATSNTNGRTSMSKKYTSTQRADESLVSRFTWKIELDYNTEVEKKLVANILGSKKEANKLVNAMKRIRKGIRQSGIHFDASTRHIMSMAKGLKMGLSLENVVKNTIYNSLSKTERVTIENLIGKENK